MLLLGVFFVTVMACGVQLLSSRFGRVRLLFYSHHFSTACIVCVQSLGLTNVMTLNQ